MNIYSKKLQYNGLNKDLLNVTNNKMYTNCD